MQQLPVFSAENRGKCDAHPYLGGGVHLPKNNLSILADIKIIFVNL